MFRNEGIIMEKYKKEGFTAIELMVVVAIIAILAAIAIPNFISSRQISYKNTCIANLKQIEGALALYALDLNGTASAVGDLVPTYLNSVPSCPADGTYDVSGPRPTCSVSGHELS